MKTKNKLFTTIAMIAILGIQIFWAVPALATSPKVTSGNKVLVNKVINGERVYWTQADQNAANKRQAEFETLIKGKKGNQGTGSTSIAPNSVPGAPPYSGQSTIGTGDGLTSDFLYDYLESTASGAKDINLILEDAAANTCGPIAAHNLLTHYGSALNFTQLEPKVGYSGGQTGWSSQYATGLNNPQQSSYTYTAFGYLSSSTSAWDSTYIDLACAAGTYGVPTAMNAYGQLPRFTHAVGHWFVGYGYTGWYNDTNEQNKMIKYFDSSEEHIGYYWFNVSESSFIGNISIYGIVA